MSSPDINELDKRLCIVETKLETHSSVIAEIKLMLTKVEEKIDLLIVTAAASKAKQAILYSGITAASVIAAEVIIRKIVG